MITVFASIQKTHSQGFFDARHESCSSSGDDCSGLAYYFHCKACSRVCRNNCVACWDTFYRAVDRKIAPPQQSLQHVGLGRIRQCNSNAKSRYGGDDGICVCATATTSNTDPAEHGIPVGRKWTVVAGNGIHGSNHHFARIDIPYSVRRCDDQ